MIVEASVVIDNMLNIIPEKAGLIDLEISFLVLEYLLS